MNRNNMAKQIKYAPGGKTKMKCGGKVKRMAKGGQCRGGGAATRGMKYGRNG